MTSQLKVEDLTILVDTREQIPFQFEYKGKPFRTERATLKTGDYMIAGYPDAVVERKSLDDLFGCIGNSRERFENELQRMLSFSSRLVVVESPFNVLACGDYRSKIHPKAAVGSILGWMAWGIPFVFADHAHHAAQLTANFLYIAANRKFREIHVRSQREANGITGST